MKHPLFVDSTDSCRAPLWQRRTSSQCYAFWFPQSSFSGHKSSGLSSPLYYFQYKFCHRRWSENLLILHIFQILLINGMNLFLILQKYPLLFFRCPRSQHSHPHSFLSDCLASKANCDVWQKHFFLEMGEKMKNKAKQIIDFRLSEEKKSSLPQQTNRSTYIVPKALLLFVLIHYPLEIWLAC